MKSDQKFDYKKAHEDIVQTAVDLVNIIMLKANTLYPDSESKLANKNRWLFKGRVLNLLYSDHYNFALKSADQITKEIEENEKII